VKKGAFEREEKRLGGLGETVKKRIKILMFVKCCRCKQDKYHICVK
jgi:hypothetical protein